MAFATSTRAFRENGATHPEEDEGEKKDLGKSSEECLLARWNAN